MFNFLFKNVSTAYKNICRCCFKCLFLLYVYIFNIDSLIILSSVASLILLKMLKIYILFHFFYKNKKIMVTYGSCSITSSVCVELKQGQYFVLVGLDFSTRSPLAIDTCCPIHMNVIKPIATKLPNTAP